jgi:hypothetical protein
MLKRVAIFLLSVSSALLIPSIACAHGLAVYVSTPVTPPKGWLWVPIVFVVGTIIIDCYALRKKVSPARLVWREFVVISIFFLIFYGIGSGCAKANTAPPPGLGPPHTAFYGLPFLSVAREFLTFNLLGLGLFLLSKTVLFFTLRVLDSGVWKKLCLAGTMAYAIALIPYVAANALTHGWAGSYVNWGCQDNISRIAHALVRYAEEHDGKLPEAESTETLIEEIDPPLRETIKRYKRAVIICPIEAIYHKHPRPYEWNPSFSGLTLTELVSIDDYVLRCPARHTFGGSPTLYSKDLLKEELSDIRRAIERRTFDELERKVETSPEEPE